ncbi:unnamed protein product [Trifolium pratense]|uniref:Uncharacterized protein n=1 Tax=Trifolium pratense TaxID=57577 RepID=A0ACB0J230_TRIPR|nr:unnamed protein product [Trifolium pratense]
MPPRRAPAAPATEDDRVERMVIQVIITLCSWPYSPLIPSWHMVLGWIVKSNSRMREAVAANLGWCMLGRKVSEVLKGKALIECDVMLEARTNGEKKWVL